MTMEHVGGWGWPQPGCLKELAATAVGILVGEVAPEVAGSEALVSSMS